MSALPRDTTPVRSSPRLVRQVAQPQQAMCAMLTWPLAREGESVVLIVEHDACVLRHEASGVLRSWPITSRIDRDAQGLLHLEASAHAEGLGELRILATLRAHADALELLYVHTNALTLLRIPGGRADVVRLTPQ